MNFNPFKSITLKGAAIAVGGYLWNHFDPNALGGNGPTIVQAVGTLITIFGMRRAVSQPNPAPTNPPTFR
jgi:hypothetical protein